MEALIAKNDLNLGDIVRAAVAGDDYALARIVDAFHDDMVNVCVVVSRDRGLAEEAVQSAWAIAWRKLGSVREPERLRPWLVRIAVNEAKQLMRKQSRHPGVEYISEGPERPGGIDPATGIDSLDLRAALERLEPDDRALLAMRYVAGFDATELAAAAGLSPSGMRARLSRLLARVRQELE